MGAATRAAIRTPKPRTATVQQPSRMVDLPHTAGATPNRAFLPPTFTGAKALQHIDLRVTCHGLTGRQGGGREPQQTLSSANPNGVGQIRCHQTHGIPPMTLREARE